MEKWGRKSSGREDFFEQIKDLHEDDPSYEQLTSCFLNWYVFDRLLDGGRGTPLQYFASSASVSLEERTLLAAMAANVHSLFEVMRSMKACSYSRIS